MHIFFSGIGGTGIGPLALIAHQASYDVSGSDKQDSQYIQYLNKQGLKDIHIGQTYDQIATVHAKRPIDWFVYTSALPLENPDAPELAFCKKQGIKTSKRDELLNEIIRTKELKLIAIAGTHGKTTTTAMTIWLLEQLGRPVSYSVGAKISFGDMGHYEPGSEYFVYEADEFDRNFLAFHPYLAIITGIAWDHHDVYPTRGAYQQAFREFLDQSRAAVLWKDDASLLNIVPADNRTVIDKSATEIATFTLPGLVNRQNAWEVAQAVQTIIGQSVHELVSHLNKFPGVSRRFEPIVPGLYSDYAHTPEKIRGALQLADEVANENIVVIYEGLHNTRQHFIKEALVHLFDNVKRLYIVPSYLAREDKDLALLTPEDLRDLLSDTAKSHAATAQLDDQLKATIQSHLNKGELVLCITAGGGGSLDEWLRRAFKTEGASEAFHQDETSQPD